MQKYYDIVITGGGMIGSVLACTLARNPTLRNRSILLIESGPKKLWSDELNKRNNVYSNRVSTLNNRTKAILQKIDIWDTISSVSCKEVKDIKVWGCGSKHISTTFRTEELPDLDALAYVVENNVLVGAAMAQLENLKDHVDILHGTPVAEYILPKSSIERDDNVVVQLKDGSSLECSLLLGCDGVHSKVRESMGVQYLNWKYNQKAIVATLKINEETGNNVAWQKFLSTGPVALLPLADGYSSLVWTTTPEHAKTLLSLTSESFVDALNTALWSDPVDDYLVNNISSLVSSFLKTSKESRKSEEVIPPTVCAVIDESRASFPVGFGHAVCYVAPRVGLVGDAAHRVHPLAGLGVNLGFCDIESLDAILEKNISCGAKLGDFYYLREYETERQRDNVPKLIGIDIIQKIAGRSWTPFLAITNVGFQVTNSLHPLKKCFIKLAST